MDKNRLLDDLLKQNKEKLQDMQDTFAQALDFAFITVDYKGEPLLNYSGFTQFCKLIRKEESRKQLCHQCDAHGGLHAAITGKPYIYKCHAGLVDFAVPIIVDGNYLGAIMGGQLESGDESLELKEILPQKTNWQLDQDLIDARKTVHEFSYDRLTAGMKLLQQNMQNMLENEYYELLKKELEEKEQELLREKETRFNMEKKIASGPTFPVLETFREEDMFDILNAISSLAFLEQAEGVQQMICNFSEMLRSLIGHSGSSFVTLREELEYTDAFLKIQEKSQEGRMTYHIDVPEEFRSVTCPFMLIQSLIQNLLRCGKERGISQGKVALQGKKEGNLFVLMIQDDSEEANTKKEMQSERLIDCEYWIREEADFLTSTNRLLKDLYGMDCGIFVQKENEEQMDAMIQVKLPVHKRTA